MENKKAKVWLLLSPAACLAAAALSLMLGSIFISPSEIWRIITGHAAGAASNIFLFSRVPRTAACLLAGAALSMSGAVLQNVLANKLASPGIIGVNAGAGLGVTICCSLGILSGWGISLTAFSFSLIAVLTISLLARSTGASRTTVILSGVAVNSLFNALSDALTVMDPEIGLLSMDFRVGGFSSVSYPRLIPAGILILIGAGILMTLTNELDVLSLGDETAGSVGLNVRFYRFLFLLLAALLAGAAVSFTGLLGFVGLIVPHFVRKITGNESRIFLPVTAFSGAAFVTVCDLAARLIFDPYELPVGIIMSLIGGPVFIGMLLRYRKGHRHD